jgi:F0F1-type ATP synthase membrane subunit b/b'
MTNIAMDFLQNVPNKDVDNVLETLNIIRLVLMAVFIPWFLYKTTACCIDPLNKNLREKLEDYENQLLESENMITDLQEELKEAEELVEDMAERYKDCRRAAQRFIDTYPEAEVSLSKRKRTE